jgi:flagellar biosynthesis protein FlhB
MHALQNGASAVSDIETWAPYDVVIVGDDSYVAVRLHYMPPQNAPKVLAKCSGAAASRLCMSAVQDGVIVLADETLAGRLYREVCGEGGEIPRELYESVAQALYRLIGRERRRHEISAPAHQWTRF